MSYDLCLFRLPEGADPAEFYERLQEKEEQGVIDQEGGRARALDAGDRRAQRIADSLKSCWPTFKQFEPPSPQPWIELSDEKIELQVMVTVDTVNITLPYFRPESKEMLNLAAHCIETLNRDAGLVAFDPQLARLVSASDMAALEAQYHNMDRHLPGILAHNRDAKPKKAWWKLW